MQNMYFYNIYIYIIVKHVCIQKNIYHHSTYIYIYICVICKQLAGVKYLCKFTVGYIYFRHVQHGWIRNTSVIMGVPEIVTQCSNEPISTTMHVDTHVILCIHTSSISCDNTISSSANIWQVLPLTKVVNWSDPSDQKLLGN